ncbi:GNAT family N-acetyltransferase [Amycolatopsis jiangsuensis]|uniref:Ribosomal protein S18 acetylase RimI-like enzyme n=1 Tax=Amycolatopsis jiangsuensis TaxID=1181879 RepID=A0A840J5Q6_9PSEU|nr:GNAT family N-acetyltransferase [Amycolatopsis jiangsuensis]MBB4688734.1 ribosomal protein S18 acetylase RimI-like enzyme [Amycolatopsis jiangsuensis]
MSAPIRRARVEDQDAVVAVLSEAFSGDPLARWLFPDLRQRVRLQTRFYLQQLTHSAAETYLIGDAASAAVWHLLPASGATVEPPSGEIGSRLRELGRMLAPRHPAGRPHLYLFCMGVATGHQGGGLGSAMVRDRLARADADGLGAYLEASSARSRALYQRHGFADLGAPVRLAGGPVLWPMWREPAR